MSEEANQEDLSVEDILSSIKNILVDENGAPIETTAQEEDHPLTAPVEKEPEPEDVFDLNDSMIVPETSENSEANIEKLLNEKEETAQNPKDTTETISDTDVQDTLNISEEIDINSILKDVLPTEESNEPTVSLETSPAKEETIPETVEGKTEEVKEETIDASASIINNFAKVFAEKQQEHAQQQAQETPIAQNIQNSIEQTGITDMVKQAITEQVKTSINDHFEKIASNIIADQTKIWLNEHLADIVEKTVAKEIERVIAKVGS